MNKNNEQGTKKGFLSGVDQNTCPLIDTLRPFSNIELVIFRGSIIFLKDEAKSLCSYLITYLHMYQIQAFGGQKKTEYLTLEKWIYHYVVTSVVNRGLIIDR